MRALLFVVAAVIGLASTATAEEEKIYPGAKVEEMTAPAEMGLPAGSKIRYYLTDAPFDTVVSFYQGLYKAIPMPEGAVPILPDGKRVRAAFFSLDGQTDITTAEHILKVQRPFIGDLKARAGGVRSSDVRDVTVIQFADYR